MQCQWHAAVPSFHASLLYTLVHRLDNPATNWLAFARSGAYANDQPPPYKHIDGVERTIAAQLGLFKSKGVGRKAA
jgi:hypothetical protein